MIGVFTGSFTNKTKIVCVGDSITFGECSTDGKTYPNVLKDILTMNLSDTEFEIVNLGLSSRTVQTTGDFPYVNEP